MSRNIWSDPYEVIEEGTGRLLTTATHGEILGGPAPGWIGHVPLRAGTLLLLESPYDADVRHKFHVVKIQHICLDPLHGYREVGRIVVRRVA